MAGIWRMRTIRRMVRHIYKPYTHVVYIYFVSNNGLASNYLYGNGFLAEY
jgi:hypothetical protein